MVPYQKNWDTKPINCVGVQTFRIEIHKCSNVEISHSFMLYLIRQYNYTKTTVANKLLLFVLNLCGPLMLLLIKWCNLNLVIYLKSAKPPN